MRKLWWRLLCVILMFYIVFAGLLVPLRSGITEVNPSHAMAGEVIELQIQGYNSHFLKAGNNRVWLKLDSLNSIQAQKVLPLDDNHMKAEFALPDSLPGNLSVRDLTLIVDNQEDGPSVLPSALFVSKDTSTTNTAAAAWGQNTIHDLDVHWKFAFPFRNILSETIRNLYFHVPLWFAMIILLFSSVVYSARYLWKFDPMDDQKAVAFTRVGLLFGFMGLITGAIWAKHTWGAYWSWDVKQNMTAISMLIYMAYFVLRNSFEDYEKEARIGAVYNIFAFSALIPLIFVIPRMTDSLHPGNGGNPALGSQDLDNTMRLVFYPAVIAWILLGLWISTIVYRYIRLEEKTWSE